MQGRLTGYFLSEHVHVGEIFENSRTRERARPVWARIGKVGPFRTVSPFVRGSPDHSNNVQTGRRDWGVIGTSRSHWLARTCARRARVVKTDPEGGAQPDQIATRSRQNILKIPRLHE